MSKPADRWTSKYDRRTAVAVEDYTWGVTNPSRPPATAAIGARKTLEAKMQNKATWDKWEDSLKFVGDEGVKAAAIAKGPARYPSGVQYGMPKFSDFATKFKAHLDSNLPAVQAMPTATLEESLAKSAAMIRANAKFRYKKK